MDKFFRASCDVGVSGLSVDIYGTLEIGMEDADTCEVENAVSESNDLSALETEMI